MYADATELSSFVVSAPAVQNRH